MSLSSVTTPAGNQFTAPLINEMQREDFLALAAALRQFNVYDAGITQVLDPEIQAESAN
ncbi:hypothetical protein TRP66_04240 [Pseudomonas sp. JDS28PS106]|uniref:hypothetical protein n=1 Tax=Pseudomonas sp. JDS28PS106 TaxID=2497235 RepID=UPI002FD687E3